MDEAEQRTARRVEQPGSLFRARMRGRWLRLRRWEYWPAWVVYLPLLWMLPWRTRRSGSVRLATCVNPGIAMGGLAGESKSEILGLFGDHPAIARWILVKPGDARDRCAAICAFTRTLPSSWPVVVKPDRGERGTGVVIARDPDELLAAVSRIRIPLIAQEYIPGREYGVFWVASAQGTAGHVVSIAHKAQVRVHGDGSRTLLELLIAEDRLLPFLQLHLRRHAKRLGEVVAAGESVAVTELGTHALGATFFDARELASPELDSAIEEMFGAATGLDFGRLDIRVPDEASLLRGASLRVLEFNGLTAEPAHIYDPGYSLRRARQDLLWQWTAAVELGRVRSATGTQPASWLEILRAVRRHARDASVRGG